MRDRLVGRRQAGNRLRGVLAFGICLGSGACGGGGDDAPATGRSVVPEATSGAEASVPVVPKAFITSRDTLDNVDSPAVWHGAGGEHWLIVTAKEGDVLRVSDARTGEMIRRVGGSGTEIGRFERPNGVTVADDLVFVVERDNRRVQVLSLPEFRPLGTFGGEQLRRPYGIAVLGLEEPAAYDVWVTDDYEQAEDVVPPDSLLDERVRRFRVRVGGGGVRSESFGAFGATSGPGVLHVVESLALDPVHGRLLVAEEEEGDSRILVYTPEGVFTGAEIGTRWFPHQAEGIALYACPDGSGFWVTTDQGEEVNTFHLFDREGLDHVASFRGDGVLNTDGIVLTQRSYEGFPGGALFAVHDDGNTAALRWADIAHATGVPATCG